MKMSSTYPCRHGYCNNASKAVDGVYEPEPGQVEESFFSATEYELNPWIQIDLGRTYNIFAVKVWKAYSSDIPGITVMTLKLRLPNQIKTNRITETHN